MTKREYHRPQSLRPRLALLALCLLQAHPCAVGEAAESRAPSVGSAQRVFMRDGQVRYTAAYQGEHQIVGDGRDNRPVLSPDGTSIAFVREQPSKAPGGDRSADIMVFKIADRSVLKLTSATSIDLSDDPVETLTWSLDGSFLYALVGAYATTDDVVQIRIADGRRRTVIDGTSLAVIRSGPMRGYLLVRRHKYLRGVEGGTYDPVDVVRPDGRVMTTVPGSGRDDQRNPVALWLQAHGWTAS